jgi:sporulation-control protein spo0M
LEEKVGIHAMAAAANVQIVFDKSVYAPGDTITATVTWESGEVVQTATFSLSVSVTNQNNEETSASATFQVSTGPATDTFTVHASDDGNRTWDIASQDATSAVVTTTA